MFYLEGFLKSVAALAVAFFLFWMGEMLSQGSDLIQDLLGHSLQLIGGLTIFIVLICWWNTFFPEKPVWQ